MPAPKIIQFPPQEKSSGGGKPRKKKRADGRYQVKAYYTDPATGQRKEKFFYGKTQSEAQAKKKEFQDLLATGADPHAMNITVAAYVQKWLALRALKDQGRKTTRTYDTYCREAQRLTDALGAKQLRQVTQSDLMALLLSRSGMSSSAINYTYNTLSQIFSAAVGDRLIYFNPMAGVSKPDGTSGTHRAIEPWERDLILSTWAEHRFGLAAMLMLYAGLRRSEAYALQWQDISFQDRIITVRASAAFDRSGLPVVGATKTEAGQRRIPIVPQLMDVLNHYKRSTGYVCLSAKGQPMTESASDRGWDSYLYFLGTVKCGCPRRWVDAKNKKAAEEHPDLYSGDHQKYTWEDVIIRTHDLRHSFCTMLYDAGVDVKTTQYLMGHASIEVTMKIYTHLSEQKNRSSIGKLLAYTSPSTSDIILALPSHQSPTSS